MRQRVNRLIARGILSTRAVDKVGRLFYRARSAAVVRWASPAVMTEFNALAYGRDDVYRPGTPTFRNRWFPWEAAAIREHFDPPPGRILVGGAGGGREAFALAAMGYEVVAFEPAANLAEAMAANVPESAPVQAFRAAYEDLPRLEPVDPTGTGADLKDLGPFAAAVMGWGSFSHLPSVEDRVQALRSMGEATDGPILVSFLTFRQQERVPRERRPRHWGDNFSIFIGYYHTLSEEELNELAQAAGLTVVALNTDETESTWPHAVLRRLPLVGRATQQVGWVGDVGPP